MKLLLSLVLAAMAMPALAVSGSAGPYRFSLRTDPDILPVGRAKLIFNVTDPSGKPVPGASIRVLAQMPNMPMGEREEAATAVGAPGTYEAPAVFGMAGAYDATITISGILGKGNTSIHLATGESASAGKPIAPIVIGIGAVVLLAAAVLIRARRSGRRLDYRRIFSRQTAGAVVVLGSALAVAIWAVNTQRRPGAMTPLEAQGMDMSTPAPEGTLPVQLAKVESRPFSASVTYTGQAVGFVEQDIVARVGGAILSLPVYVGDRVTKGQLLARLDTTQTDPMVSQKSAQADAAANGVGIAQNEYRSALAEETEARSEEEIRKGEIDETTALVAAAVQEQASASAKLKMEQASVADAQSQVAAADAERIYASEERSRELDLFDKGAVSKDELQQAQDAATTAAAKAREARAGVVESTSRVASARAEISKAAAEVLAAESKLREAQAEHHAHMAHVRSASAAADGAKQRIGQAAAEADAARADLRGANTERSYAEIRSDIDGFVTARLIGPGVVVSPGQSLLKVSQVAPIRLQANVPEGDLAVIRLGARVAVKEQGGSGGPIALRVASVSPAVDPTSRMGTVEAIYGNADARFKPGQYLSMEIAIGGAASAKVVPADAIRREEDRAYVWVAEPASNNQFTVSRHEVKLGLSSGGFASVQTGISVGQEVVVSAPQDLSDGSLVTAKSDDDEAAAKPPNTDQTIEITAAGYDPPTITVPAGKRFKVTFIRRDDKSCGTEVIFPDLGIRKALPLNQPVAIELPPQPAGKELHFTCPMNMLNGKAVAK